MWFDFHADIGYDLFEEHLQGNDQRFSQFHLPRLKQAKVHAVNIACYFEQPTSWEKMQACVSFVYDTLKNHSDVHLVLDKEDLDAKGLLVILSVEGMCGIDQDVENRITWLYDHGIRIASLCWNEENALATGIKGNPNHGLTTLGLQAIKQMKLLGMLLDVSHLNDASFFDVMKQDISVLATHSNARALCNHPRNLTDEQLCLLKKKRAFVGANATGAFVAKRKEEQNIKHYVEQMKYLQKQLDEQSVGMGFDFMDYMSDINWNLQDLQSVEELLYLSNEMTKKDILQLGYQNGIQYLKRVL
ncbi:MAG: membrane dipeptidase [Erysipelotrichaceae bacterium]|nr:membrane dipeptidase [Erysipelotrichaceae bacterium]